MESESNRSLRQLLLSRRTLLQGAGGAFVSTGLFSLVGCGGSGGGSKGTTFKSSSISGTVTLPKGLTASGLQAMTLAGKAPVSGTGGFTAKISANGPQNVFLFDGAGNLLLVGPLRVGRTNLSSRSTAEFLAFQSLGAFVHMGEISAAVWSLLETADLTAIQTAIESAISSSGNAWAGTAQANVKAAVVAFQTSILGSATPSTAQPQKTLKADGIIVTPTNTVSGIQVSSDDLKVCTITNSYRRRTWLYSSPLTLTKGGATQNLTLSLQSQNLPATSGITSLLSSLAQLAGGATFYTATSATVNTPLSDSTATQETYGIWVVGPSDQLASFTGVPKDVQTGWWEVTVISIVVDYILPWLINIALPLSGTQLDNFLGNLNKSTGGADITDLSAPLKDVVSVLLATETIFNDASSGDFKAALQDVGLLILNSSTFYPLIVNLLLYVLEGVVEYDAEVLNSVLRGILAKFLTPMDLVASINDAIMQIADLVLSKPVETFNITVTPPKLTVTPADPTVGWGSNQTFTANIVGATSSTSLITYTWTLAGPGQLKNPASGITGTTVSTSGNTVSYIAPGSGTENATATLTVTANYGTPQNAQEIASTETTITLSSQVVTYGTLTCGGRYDAGGRYYWGIWTKLPIPANAVSCNELMYNFDDTAYWGTQIPCSGAYNATTKSWSWGGGDDIAGDGSDSGPAGTDGNLYFGLTGGSGPGSGNLSNDIGGTTAYMNSRFSGMIVKGTFQVAVSV